MILYHGSNLEVKEPRIIKSKRLLDFGTGFYLTSDYGQAEKWALRTTSRREEGVPTITVFSFDENLLSELNVLSFEGADKEWLRYVSLNRTDKTAEDSYDIVMGPVAKDQLVFKTEKALAMLKYNEVKTL